jgi:hypothetical protein
MMFHPIGQSVLVLALAALFAFIVTLPRCRRCQKGYTCFRCRRMMR